MRSSWKYLYTCLRILDASSSRAASFSLLTFLLAIMMFNEMEVREISRQKNLQLSSSAKTAAWERATRTVRSALPIRSLPSKLRMIYFASWPRHDANILVMIETFLFCDYKRVNQKTDLGRPIHTECPLLSAISLRFLNTFGRVKGLGLNRVFWLFLEF